ncbi:hypothetical protein MC885_009242 [Smutsia gigantea]|nr:hypothetical protein MC885_009242 [Smutsia gigantea]
MEMCLPQGLQCPFSTARTASSATFTREALELPSIADSLLCHVPVSPIRTSPLLSSIGHVDQRQREVQTWM